MSNNPKYARSSLGLDFTLVTDEQRAHYIDKLFQERGPNWTPTAKEQEIIANYLLYGVDDSGKSPVQSKEILGQSSIYSKKPPESLDQLVESPVFNEYSVSKIGSRVQYKIPKPNLNREEYKASTSLNETQEMEQLWAQIDQIDTILRKQKDGLLNLPLRRYYLLRHLLIELRRQQYTIKDFQKPQIQQHIQAIIYRGGDIDEGIFGVSDTIGVAPLGYYQKGNPIFENPGNPLNKEITPDHQIKFWFDFREENHIYQLVYFREELETQATLDPESALKDLLNTFEYYCAQAKLSTIQRKILELKQLHWTNEDIRQIVNKEFGTKYAAPYISTIFTHQICPSIAEAAVLHYDQYRYRKDSSKWKICTGCGRRLLRDQRIFSKYTRAKDGLQSKCKECDREDRQYRKKAGKKAGEIRC